MIPDPRFSNLPGDFWAYVRLLSEGLGYSLKKTESQPSTLKAYRIEQVQDWLGSREGIAEYTKQTQVHGEPYLVHLLRYLNFRSTALNKISTAFMDRDEARQVFESLKQRYKPTCQLPLNKQKGEKRHEAYLTCIINMLTEKALGGCYFNQSPYALTTIQSGKRLVRTLSRRFDGAYPSTTNPIAVWEVKKYYGTTTFGSRVADGVYETMLDGYELADLKFNEGIQVKHYLLIDDYFTWWKCGKSYLCRIIDALHMGLVDEVLFGREVLKRWPKIVRSWI